MPIYTRFGTEVIILAKDTEFEENGWLYCADAANLEYKRWINVGHLKWSAADKFFRSAELAPEKEYQPA